MKYTDEMASAFNAHVAGQHNADYEVCPHTRCRAAVLAEVAAGLLDHAAVWPPPDDDEGLREGAD